MEWTTLGHAMWLAEAAGLRLLFDPLLAPTHHGGVFEVVPRRDVFAEGLRPDFVLVSHRHPDHFDVPSLHALARLDPESVVVTPDRLVGWAAERLGFSTVRIVPPNQRIELDGVAVITTPSVDAREWGAMVATDAGVAWNQVDTVLRDAAEVQRVTVKSLEALGHDRVALGLVRWQPMLEIAAVLGHPTRFPYRQYGGLLDQIDAIGASAVVPSACGGSHVDPFRWMDRHVFPLTPDRFARDLAGRSPSTVVLPSAIGTRYAVEAGQASVIASASPDLVTLEQPPVDPRGFEPMSIPPLRDDNPRDHDEATMRPRVQAWIEGDLVDALGRMHARLPTSRVLRCVVAVVWPAGDESFTIVLGDGAPRCERRDDRDWDLRNQIAGSQLWEVVEGRRAWGDVLLSGCLRARTRAYDATPTGLSRLDVGETFLYYALSYDESVERSVRWEVETLLAAEHGV